MLHEFLIQNRFSLIHRCRSEAARRSALELNGVGLEQGIPLFLDQLIATLQMEQTPEQMPSRKIVGPAGAAKPVLSELRGAAAKHGFESWRHGFSVEQVVHHYGDLCQAITDLAFELDAPVGVEEFRTLNRCLDDAIAHAVTEFSYRREVQCAEQAAAAAQERLACLAHELRNLTQTASFALEAIDAGNLTFSGATGAVLRRSLAGLRTLIDRSVADARRITPAPARHQWIPLADFIAEVAAAAALEAEARGCKLTVSSVDPSLAIDVERHQLFSALANLMQNACKFTRDHTEVVLRAYASGDRILIDVEDHCGGWPDGDVEGVFKPFTQRSSDRSGLGLGLSIARRSVEANGGSLSVRDIPGSGCIFTVDLPRHALAREARPEPPATIKRASVRTRRNAAGNLHPDTTGIGWLPCSAPRQS